MIKFYDITQDTLNNKEFEDGALYFCNDTLMMYYDSPSEGKRICINSDIIQVQDEQEFSNILSYIPNKFYFCQREGSLYYVDIGDGAYTVFNIKSIDVINAFNKAATEVNSGTNCSEGDFLRIVNGVPAWVTIPTIDEVAF